MMLELEDLTLRDVEEAQTYGLTNDGYLELRNIIEDRIREGVRKDERERLRGELRNNLRGEILEEVTKECRARITAEVESAAHARAYKELQKELADERVTDQERSDFREAVRHMEVDCLVQADVASTMAIRTRRSAAVLRFLWISALITALPTVLAIYPVGMFLLHVAETPLYWAIAVAVVASAAFVIGSSALASIAEDRFAKLLEVSSDYTTMANRARRLKVFDVHTLITRSDMANSLASYAHDKDKLDDRLHSDTQDQARSWKTVRERLMVEDVDPEKLFKLIGEGSGGK